MTMKKTYRIVRIDDCTRNEYTTTNKNAFKAADRFGRAHDKVEVYDGDTLVDCVMWTGLGYKRPSRKWFEEQNNFMNYLKRKYDGKEEEQ